MEEITIASNLASESVDFSLFSLFLRAILSRFSCWQVKISWSTFDSKLSESDILTSSLSMDYNYIHCD